MVRYYGLALVFVAAALGLSLLLQPIVPHVFVYLFLTAVVTSAWFGKSGPGLFAVAVASLTLDYFFLLPLHTLGISWEAWPYFLPFLLSALAASWISSTRKLAAEKSRLQTAALNAAASAIVITDTHGTIQWVNPAFTSLNGYRLGEAVGQNPRILKSGQQDETFYQNLWNTILAGKVWSGEITNLKKGGESYIEGMTIAPVRSENGEITHFVAIKQDLTERKQAELKLYASEEQFRQLAENIHEVFFVAEPDPVRIVYLSPAYEEVWGRPRKEAYDRPAAWIEAVHPADREEVGRFFGVTSRGVHSEMPYRIIRPDGSLRWIEARSFPVRDAAGKLIRIVGIAEDTTDRRAINEKLKLALEELKEQTQDTSKLAELVDVLQSCNSTDEAFKIIGDTLQNMLPSTAGALYIISPSRNIVEIVANWGDDFGVEKAFPPDDCWALRRGRAHRVKDSSSPLRCGHASKSLANGYVCLPLAAQGETMGVLYIENHFEPASPAAESGNDPVQILERQATAIGERISLSLANLRLREVLRGQSIRDPLTGLFNRRFMEESLERELRRAVRGNLPVALMMVDIDHFKRFNDTFGHQAGDALLRAFGNLLKETTRGQDVVCRFGGEEFAFVLAGASIEPARKRAELLREEIKQLNVRHGGQLLGAVTISIGIAVFPNDGDTAEQLLKAADDALYRAKEEGRDRIVVA